MAASECGIFLPFLANSKKQGQNKQSLQYSAAVVFLSSELWRASSFFYLQRRGANGVKFSYRLWRLMFFVIFVDRWTENDARIIR